MPTLLLHCHKSSAGLAWQVCLFYTTGYRLKMKCIHIVTCNKRSPVSEFFKNWFLNGKSVGQVLEHCSTYSGSWITATELFKFHKDILPLIQVASSVLTVREFPIVSIWNISMSIPDSIWNMSMWNSLTVRTDESSWMRGKMSSWSSKYSCYDSNHQDVRTFADILFKTFSISVVIAVVPAPLLAVQKLLETNIQVAILHLFV